MTYTLLLMLFLLPQGFVPYPPLPDSTFHLPTSPARIQTCTSTGLKLSTKAMTQAEVQKEAATLWGVKNIYQWTVGSTVYLGVGTKTPFGYVKPDPRNCLSPNCWKNGNGSWRSLWNAVQVDLCKRRQLQ